MSHFYFLLEEPSMEEALHGILPRLLPEDVTYQCIPHEGKQDLVKSIPRKIRGLTQKPGDYYFVILHDQDSSDCIELKQKLLEKASAADPDKLLVRIVCRELESWYLGDLQAVDSAYPGANLAKLQEKRKFRAPDGLVKPSNEIKKLVPDFQKIDGARRIGRLLNLESNKSKSFLVFVSGLNRLLENREVA